MNRRGARTRAQRRYARVALLQAASKTWPTRPMEPARMRYHDSRLVHDVFSDVRTFTAWNGTKYEEGTHLVWTTACGLVIAVGEMRFSWTKKPASCLECVVGNVSKRKEFVPWMGG